MEMIILFFLQMFHKTYFQRRKNVLYYLQMFFIFMMPSFSFRARFPTDTLGLVDCGTALAHLAQNDSISGLSWLVGKQLKFLREYTPHVPASNNFPLLSHSS